MKIWITGGAGFVAKHLSLAAIAQGYEVVLTDIAAGNGVESLDIRDAASCADFARRAKPDACIHLAGVAFVPDAAKHPNALRAINVEGALNVAATLCHGEPFVFVSSAQVYGLKCREEAMAVGDALNPASEYAKSKAEAEAALAKLPGLNLRIARPGNHTGPWQSPKFVVPAFAHAIKAFRDGKASSIVVGNLESQRDFTDVRDVVAAYLLILKHGEKGSIYNISAGVHLTIGEVLRRLAAIAGVEIKTTVDETLWRPTDAMPAISTARLSALGWTPKYSFEETLRDIWQEVAAEV